MTSVIFLHALPRSLAKLLRALFSQLQPFLIRDLFVAELAGLVVPNAQLSLVATTRRLLQLMVAARAPVCILETTLAWLTTNDVAIVVRIDFHLAVGESQAVRNLFRLFTAGSAYIIVGSSFRLLIIATRWLKGNSALLFSGRDAAKVCREVHEVDLIDVIHHAMAACVLLSFAKPRYLFAELSKEADAFLIMITLGGCSGSRSDPISACLLQNIGSGGALLRLLGLALFQFNTAIYA